MSLLFRYDREYGCLVISPSLFEGTERFVIRKEDGEEIFSGSRESLGKNGEIFLNNLVPDATYSLYLVIGDQSFFVGKTYLSQDDHPFYSEPVERLTKETVPDPSIEPTAKEEEKPKEVIEEKPKEELSDKPVVEEEKEDKEEAWNRAWTSLKSKLEERIEHVYQAE